MALYCKVDSCLDSNPKIRKAGRAGREVYLFLLRRNRVLDADGVLPVANVDSAYLADQLMMPGNEAVTAVTACVTSGLISVSDLNVTVLGWSEEWSREPMSNAERQAAYKQRKKEAKELAAAKAASVTEGNGANVTGNGGNVREEKRREDISESAVAPPPPKPAKAPKRQAAPLSADWAPTPKHVALAAKERRDLNREADRFRDWAANAKPKVDWDAAFSNWLRSDYGAAAPVAPQRLDLGPAYDRERDFDA